MLDQITPLILTLDEAPNIGRTLGRLSWAREIVVLDSFSSDDTLRIAGEHANTRLCQRRFDTLENQWNYGLKETGITTEWVLALDADYLLSEELVLELGKLAPGDEVDGYRASFTYCMQGRPLRGTLYPPVAVLYRRRRASYYQDGHSQRVILNGPVLDLEHRIFHDDRKPLRRWFQSQQRYMRLEAAKLAGTPFSQLNRQNRIRKLVLVAPVLVLLYCLFVKRNILDGRAGISYALQRAVAETILSLHLMRTLLLGR